MTNEQLWQATLGELELCISKANFITWFKNTNIASKQDGQIIISVPNGFTKEWLKNKYHKEILKAIQNICPEVSSIEYKVGQTSEKPQPVVEKPHMEADADEQEEQTPLPVRNKENFLNPNYTFDSFVVGPNNELAYAACISVSKKPGQSYNPLFIYGGVGLGKTHLLQSIGNEVLKNDPNKKIKYASSEKFTNELIEAISGRNTKSFKNIYRDIDVLIIDDIQFLAGKEKTQEEFFHTFNTLYENGKQIVLSSDRPPKAISALEERLRSRFEGGMIADVGFPDYEIRFAILKTKAREKKFNIPEESLNYIALHIQKNIRELQGALNRVIAVCELDGSFPDVKKTAAILSNIVSQPIKKATTPKDIIKNVAEFYEVNYDDLTAKSRKKEYVKPRQIAMYLMRKEIKSSFPSIGHWLGGRDHTTAMHAFDKVMRDIEGDKLIEQEINLIIERIYSD
jgi:chromosomal replication initiator protein